MRALVWEAPRAMAVREQDPPAPGPGEALVRVAFAGICGSELGAYLGHNALRVPPLVMGHEFAGTVAALGEGAAARSPALQVGQAVTVNPLSSCGACAYCRRGDGHLCAQRGLLGAHRPGAYAEYVLAPDASVVPLPAGLSLREGALAEPVGVAVRIGALAGPVAGEPVFIAGAGPIGLLALQVLRRLGAGPVFVSDLDPARLAMAEELGARPINAGREDVVKAVRDATGGAGAAAAVDAVGATPTRAACVAATRAAGTVVLSGLHEETGPIPAADVIRRELVLRGAFAYSPANFLAAVELLAAGAVRLEPWVVEADLAEGGPWFERLVSAPGPVAKVLLVP
ncbi:MAG TPA: alcohol dehydrogenase catalytic domain-containing protein [Chloroflexaceae bacterium]|nr:alcohol dehydrogenase catalytic domain-containing protein [Chloroflexaceae bacterium]